MRKIVNQLTASIDDIFNDCYKSIADATAKTTIHNHSTTILGEAKDYDDYIPYNSSIYTLSSFNKNDSDNILSLYDVFSKKASIKSKYYDIIRSNANGQCPICGYGDTAHLDHFISKANYPQLCINPNNLIPVCKNCNPSSKQTTSLNYNDLPFHPYFEEFTEKWLECEIFFVGDSTNEYINGFNFYCRDTSLKLYDKYMNHLKAHDLHKTFSGICRSEIKANMYLHKKLLNKSPNLLMDRIEEAIETYEYLDINDCKSALYRALKRQFDMYCIYVKCCDL